ncbi:hypothetical protein [Shewanella frigidimarina]|uniref:hypothetical protein n=1 Tax=Shewanella frigidimarina TaxID=56812 RepID=UPI003D792663
MKETAKHIAENFKTYSAAVTGSAFLVCITIAILATNNLFTSFGIDFFAKAELGDYLILGVRKVTASTALLLVAFIATLTIHLFFTISTSIYQNYISKDLEHSKAVKITTYLSNITLTLLPLFIILSTILVSQNSSTLNSIEIRSAKAEIQKVTYGKNETSLTCLIFIGDISSFSHYWSISDNSVVRVNTSSIQIISTMFRAEPAPYLTATAKNPIPKGDDMKPLLISLDSPLYDKWRNENNARTKSIKEACNPN